MNHLTAKLRMPALAAASLGLFWNPLGAAINTWTGSGAGGSETLWTAGTGYSGGTFTNNIADDMDFSGITSTGASLTLSATAGTYNVKNLSFGTTASTITTTEILNFNGTGTAGQTTLNLAGAITLPSPNASIVTMGSDLTLNLTNASHVINYAKNNNVIGTDASVPVLVINSLVTGGGASATVAWGSSATTYGATGSSAQMLVLTNSASTFDAQFNGIRGQVSYTSIGNVGVASSLGAGTGANATIFLSNSGRLDYVGAGNQTTNRTISLNGSSYIDNYASDGNSTLTLNGAFGSTSTQNSGTQTLRTSISAGNTIVINSAITDVANTVSTIVSKLGLTSFYNASGVYDTTSGTGTGTLILNAANTHTNSTLVGAGTLKIGNASALGNGGAALQAGVVVGSSGNGGTTVSSGATLDLNGQTGVNELITLSGTGVGGNGALVNNSTTPASIAGGVVSSLSAANVTGLSAVPTVTISAPTSGTTATAVAKLGLSAASFGTVTVTGTYTAAPTVTISGGGGAGATATVSTAGVITITNPGSGYTTAPTIAFTGGTGGTSMSATGNATNFILDTLQVTDAGSGYTSAPTATFSSGTVNTAATVNLSSVILSGNPVNIGGTGDLTIGAVVSGSAGAGIAKVGAGTLTLAGANTYTGPTTVNAGILNFANTSAKATGTVTASAGASIGLGVGGAGYYSSANVDSLFANTLTGFTMNAASGVGIDTSAGDFTYATSQAGSRSLTKLGANTLTLSGANSYTGGTRVSAGTLNIANSFTMSGANQVTVAATGTAGTNYATVTNTSGTLTFGGTLGLNVTASLVGGESFTLFSASGGALSGNFSSVSLTGSYIASLTDTGSGIWTGSANGLGFTFSTSGINAGILSVSAVPEPSTYAAFFGTFVLAVTVLRRRRSKAGA